MYYKNCISCTSGNVNYLYAKHEVQVGQAKGVNDEPRESNNYEEFVNYICVDCNTKWNVDLTEKEGSFESDRNAWATQ